MAHCHAWMAHRRLRAHCHSWFARRRRMGRRLQATLATLAWLAHHRLVVHAWMRCRRSQAPRRSNRLTVRVTHLSLLMRLLATAHLRAVRHCSRTRRGAMVHAWMAHRRQMARTQMARSCSVARMTHAWMAHRRSLARHRLVTQALMRRSLARHRLVTQALMARAHLAHRRHRLMCGVAHLGATWLRSKGGVIHLTLLMRMLITTHLVAAQHCSRTRCSVMTHAWMAHHRSMAHHRQCLLSSVARRHQLQYSVARHRWSRRRSMAHRLHRLPSNAARRHQLRCSVARHRWSRHRLRLHRRSMARSHIPRLTRLPARLGHPTFGA
jgi:hypothetical protein